MPTTFAPDDEKQDEKLNPGQADSDRLFGGLSDAEQQSLADMEKNYGQDADPTQENSAIDRLRNQESEGSPSGGWKNDVTQSNEEGGKEKAKRWFKKASPALGIGGIFGIGGFALIALTSPSLLIVQMKETMVDKFNTQLASLEVRSNKILTAKIDKQTTGYCGAKVTLKCKFSTMSEKQVKKFKAAGIEIEADSNTKITGRAKPTSFKFKGQTITAAEFKTFSKTNLEFRSALKQAYNPRYAGFVGKAWKNVASRFKISKNPLELNAKKDKKAARTKVNEAAKEGTTDRGSRTRITADDASCEGSQCVSEDKANKINSNSEAIDGSVKDGSAARDVRSKLSGVGNIGSSTASFFKITGVMDSACQVYGALATLSYAAKAIRAAQLVRYTMVFFSVADAIKAGASPNEDDVAFLGETLTSTVKDANDSTKTIVGAATDSFGYKYAAYGDTTAPNQSMQIANRFIAGGGFVGELSNTTNLIMSFIPGGRSGAKATCGTLANPLVQGASIVLGVASLFVPGANVAKIVAQGAIAVTVGIVLAVLPGMLADIVAGTVTEDILGEESGNAITSGSGTLMSDALAAQNGNAPMTKDDAIAYNSLQTETLDRYIADEVQTTSPFDATNPNTFLGSIVFNLLPLQSSSNPLTTIGSFLTKSMASIIPSSSAITTEEYEKSLDICQDLDAAEAGFATDPFCNVIRGIPPKYLNKDPAIVVDQLVGSGQLSEEGAPLGAYSDFIDKCITTSIPLGYQNADTGFDAGEASSCIINDDNANYYLNYIDQRVEAGMSGEDDANKAGSSVAGATIDMENLYEDSTGVSCAPGTTDAGTSTGYVDGRSFPIRVCSLPNSDEPGKSGGTALVNSRVSGAVYAMLEKMKEDLSLTKIPFGDSFRSPQEQQAAIDSCGLYSNGGCAAAQGYSNHQSGVALDFEYTNEYCVHSRGIKTCEKSPIWKWLKEHAAEFGYKNEIDEWWHWSPTGG